MTKSLRGGITPQAATQMLFFCANRTISSISMGSANLICQRLSSCNRLCHGCNLLLLVAATYSQQRLRSAGAAAKASLNMLQRQLNTLVRARTHSGVGGAKSGQTRLTEMSIAKPPKSLIQHRRCLPPSTSPRPFPTTKMLQDCQKHFSQS